MRALGIEYKRMEIEDDCHIVVADVRCRYHASARYDEVVRVRTRIAESRNRTIRFSYEVFRDTDQELLAVGETLHVICRSNGKPKLLPEKYRAILGTTSPSSESDALLSHSSRLPSAATISPSISS